MKSEIQDKVLQLAKIDGTGWYEYGFSEGFYYCRQYINKIGVKTFLEGACKRIENSDIISPLGFIVGVYYNMFIKGCISGDVCMKLLESTEAYFNEQEKMSYKM